MTEFRHHGLESFLASNPKKDAGGVGVSIRITPDLGHIDLRGDSNNANFVAAAKSVLGQALPKSPNTVSSGDYRVYWLGPDEWLVICEVADTTKIIARLRESFTGQHASVVDVSGGQTTLRLEGPAAREILAKGCTLDFHPDRFKVGDCAQSGLAKANVLIGLVKDQSGFEIIVRRSFAEYLMLWLLHSAGEYGVKLTES